MPINSRRKGKSGERDVARLCQAWWRQLPVDLQQVDSGDPCQFISTPLSGGWGNASTQNAFRLAGDLSSTSKTWPFTVEVKHRESWTMRNLIAGKRSPVWEWWNQCVQAAAVEGCIPMLWFRKNRMEWMVMLPEFAVHDILGTTTSDIYFSHPRALEKVNDTGIHPIVFSAGKFLASDPKAWLRRTRHRNG